MNDIFELIDTSTFSSITLNEIDKINVLVYADDLLILAHSEEELQHHLNKLSQYCKQWKLEINIKKTKCIVFNRGNKLCRANLEIDGIKIENVKSIKYLGFTVGSNKCSLSNTPRDLSTKAKRAIFALSNKIKLSMLPTKLALKVFSSQIVPILLYGAEVWAPYSNVNFCNWDKNILERTQTQFLKRILGCDIHTPNLMIRGELGKYPLLCDIITRSVSFISHIASCDGSLANISLDLEISLSDENNILYLVRKVTPYFSETNNFLSPKNKEEAKRQSKSSYHEIWVAQLSEMSKADSFVLFKNRIWLEKYTMSIKNHRHRIALSRLRLSSHSLMIEKGRHYKPLIDRASRYCPFCPTLVEDECHFLITCPLYEDERQELLDKIRQNSSLYDDIPSDLQKFIFILTNEDENILSSIAAFTFNSFNKRDTYLSNS